MTFCQVESRKITGRRWTRLSASLEKAVNARFAAAFPKAANYEEQKAELDARIKTLSEKPEASLTASDRQQLQTDQALAEFNSEYVSLKEHVRSDLSLDIPYDQFDAIRKEANPASKYAPITLEQVNHKVEELQAGKLRPLASGLSPAHPILYGNLFASNYFLMTGFSCYSRDHRLVYVSDDFDEGTSTFLT